MLKETDHFSHQSCWCLFFLISLEAEKEAPPVESNFFFLTQSSINSFLFSRFLSLWIVQRILRPSAPPPPPPLFALHTVLLVLWKQRGQVFLTAPLCWTHSLYPAQPWVQPQWTNMQLTTRTGLLTRGDNSRCRAKLRLYISGHKWL